MTTLALPFRQYTKCLFSLSLIITLLLGGAAPLQAQETKLAHINVAELLQAMPATDQAKRQLEKYAQQLQKQNQTMLQEYQTKIKEFQEKKALMDEAVKEVKQQEISDLQKRIQQFRKTSQQKLAEKRQEIYSPIMKKAENAIETVAERNGYDYVFDTSSGSTVYANEGDNIMSEVKAELGLN